MREFDCLSVIWTMSDIKLSQIGEDQFVHRQSLGSSIYTEDVYYNEIFSLQDHSRFMYWGIYNFVGGLTLVNIPQK